jgi:hypothetical protein
MIASHPTTTTHTVEMQQISELNHCLALRPAHVITAGDLGLANVSVTSKRVAGGLPSSARIVRVCWDGPPEYPYLHGHFAAEGSQDSSLHVDLHTAALRELSHRLHLHHTWGWGRPTP